MEKDNKKELIQGFLKEMPIFKSLSEPHINKLAKDFVVLQAKKGETVFYQSDQSTDLYIVLDGSVRASLLNQEGQELILAAFKKGDFFGEMSLLDGMPRSATIIAVEDLILAMLKRELFLSAVKNDPMIAIDLLSSVVQRLRTANGMIESLAFLDVSQRLIKLFLQIASTGSEKNNEGFLRIGKITHRELAARTGASREAISKVIKVLIFRKILKEDERHFFISPKAEQEVF
ncbi:MAG: Crp/Fnr family transcriptional regulator [Nitrospiraceae bacterium]|nr:Crp/Fnr family transcriptional regulator [Nitrospiraceae bacterium]